ncbi:hypothetical protein M9H77_30247 [Catharanthus roseus]|uniref:Uncharacterized protein n=1 Tax=Catharanthus roseus TaxID=4058 RepID=A0ACB9ZYK3_CATRO|nr:hypothetical protein M9H77_30247 [Catharanthus roseus]
MHRAVLYVGCQFWLRSCVRKRQWIALYVTSLPYEGLFRWRGRFKLGRVDPLEEGRRLRRLWPNRLAWDGQGPSKPLKILEKTPYVWSIKNPYNFFQRRKSLHTLSSRTHHLLKIFQTHNLLDLLLELGNDESYMNSAKDSSIGPEGATSCIREVKTSWLKASKGKFRIQIEGLEEFTRLQIHFKD